MARAMPPLATVELGEHDPVDRDRFEKTGLAHAVLPVVASMVSSVSWERPRLLADDPPDLGELGHQVVLGVQAPGGVDDDHVGTRSRPCLTASKATAPGSGPRRR